MMELRCCVILPTYNNEQTLLQVIDDILEYTDQLIIVNDGSTDSTTELLSSRKDLEVLSYEKNQGKGYALRQGFIRARKLGFRYAISIDSDAQHKASDLPVFIQKLKEEPNAIIIGARNMNQENVPGKSSFGNRFSNFWFKVNTGIIAPDTQSGYRLYPIEQLKDISFHTKKYEFEVEVLVRASWAGIAIVSVPIDVYYPAKEDRITHFRPFQDFSRISVLNTVLVTTALFYIKPRDFFRSLKKKSVKEFWRTYVLSSEESNEKLAGSIALGAFFSTAPFWGFQMLLVVFFATFFKLNKVISLLVSNLSFGAMAPLIIYFSYRVGLFILGRDHSSINLSDGFSIEMANNLGSSYLIGAFILAGFLSLFLGLGSYLLFVLFRTSKPTSTDG